MSLDPAANFAKSRVSTGYSAGATSIVLDSSDINLAQWPDPATYGAYNAVWWDSTTYPDPADDPLREIVRVTAKNSTTLTITRAQETTTATAKNTSGSTYKIAMVPTKKLVDDINTAMTDTGSAYGWVTDAPYNATGDGVTDDYAAFAAAVAALTHIVIPSGTYVIGDDLSVGSGITLEIHAGATLAPDSGMTLTIYGPIIAGDYDWQGGAGVVTLGTRTGLQSDRWDGTDSSTLIAPGSLTVTSTLTVGGNSVVGLKTYTSGDIDLAALTQPYAIAIAHGEGTPPALTDLIACTMYVHSGDNSNKWGGRDTYVTSIDGTNINVYAWTTAQATAGTTGRVRVTFLAT